MLLTLLVVAAACASAIWLLGQALPWSASAALLAVTAAGLLVLWGMLLAQWMARPHARLLQAARQRHAALGQPDAPRFSQFLDVLAREVEAAGRPMPLRRSDDHLLMVAGDTRQLKRVIDSLPVGVAIADASFSVQYVNATYTRLLGWETTDLQGRRAAAALFDDQSRPGFMRQFDLLADPPGELVARFDACCRGGGRLPVQWHMVPLFDRQRRFDGIIAVVQDRFAEVQARRQAERLSRQLAVFSEAAVEHGFVMLDAPGRVTSWSRGAESLTRFSAARMLGHTFSSLFAPEAARRGLPEVLMAQARETGQAEVEMGVRKADGSSFIGVGRLYHHAAENGVQGTDDQFALVLSDQTQARLAERRLVESEARLTAVIASASDAIISTDIEGKVLLFNPAAERIFRISFADMAGQPLDRLLPASARRAHHGMMAEFAESRVSRRAMGLGRVKGVRADGVSIDLEAAISQAEVQGRTVLTAILRDITDRLRADLALANYQVQLAGLSHRLLAQEKETTRRLAQALHDDLGQTLAAMRLVHDVGMRKAAPGTAVAGWMQRIDGMINDANRQVRRVLIELRPPLLDDAGLHAALDNELQQQQATHEDVDLQLDWRARSTEARWPGDVEHAVFMIAREAIGNALRHADPKSVQVRVAGTVGQLALRVTDDGRGEPHIENIVRPGHLGLVGMRERALAIGAVLEIRSSQAGGTTVNVTWGVDDASFVPD